MQYIKQQQQQLFKKLARSIDNQHFDGFLSEMLHAFLLDEWDDDDDDDDDNVDSIIYLYAHPKINRKKLIFIITYIYSLWI